MIFDFDKVINHLHLIGIYLGFSIGLLRLYRFKKNRMNVLYGITFICISLFLYIGGDSDFYLLQSQTGSHYDWSLLFFGLIIYSCLMCRSLMRKSIGLELRSNDAGINLLFTFTINFVLSFIFRDEVTFNIAGNLVSIAITSYTLVEITTSIHTRKLPKIYYHLTVMAFFMTFALVLDVIAIFKNDLHYHLISNVIPGLLLVYFHLLEIYAPIITDKKTMSSLSLEQRLQRRKESVALIQEKTNRKKSEPSESKGLLKDNDLVRIEERLNSFLDEKRFLDEELRLPDLSAYLGISVHQASLYLNQYRNTSFTDFINQKRIEEAKRLILEETNKNLIDIGLECGFNSYSPFHRACIRFTGYSPKDLRNLVLKKEAPKPPLVPDIGERRTT
ncbi:helix-turn-helix domain-containing protein [Leptospira stimsonii]|nr:helix-turn-helix domain-containing protein [Leptospira stimsonii]